MANTSLLIRLLHDTFLQSSLQYISDNNPTTLMTGQDLSFTGLNLQLSSFKLRSLTNAMQSTFFDVLGSENKTKVPLYFSMLKHDGLLHC